MRAIASPGPIVVGIGECRIARVPAAALSTVALGSCIAVMAWDWKLKLGALSHVMLPDSSIDPRRARSKPHVFADTAVPELLKALIGQGSSKRQLRWCLAGGATMMAGSAHFDTGKRNQLALKDICRRLGVFINGEDLGGNESRSVRLDLQSGQIVVRMGTGRERILRQAAVNLTAGSAEGGPPRGRQ